MDSIFPREIIFFYFTTFYSYLLVDTFIINLYLPLAETND